jgi:hypothetical protein
MRRAASLLVLGLLGTACGSSGGSAAGGEAAAADTSAMVQVRFPDGACATGWLEVQEFLREAQIWAPHPRGDRIRTGVCRWEEPDRLLNELRVRCIDPTGRRPPSAWVVGVDVRSSIGPESCRSGALSTVR